jgi:hypothetical protein
MPTDRDALNPSGLMAAARQGNEGQAAAERLRAQLAGSKRFAARFDEAVMREDRDQILALVAETGVPDDVSVAIAELDPDRYIAIVYTAEGSWGKITITVSWNW